MKKHLFTLLIFLLANHSYAQKTVDLSGKNLTTVPEEYNGNSSIECLILDDNPLVELPDWLPTMSGLKKLSLNEVQKLKVIDAFNIISNCKQLEELQWRSGNLLFVPRVIANCSKLQKLDLANNGLFEIPYYFKDNQLKELNISSNLIDSLGPYFVKFKQLRQLDFSNNPGINTAYNYHTLSQIKTLQSLSLRGINKIPEEIQLLQQVSSFDLSHSRFNQLPESFSQLTELRHLNLGYNTMIELHQVLESISNLGIRSLIIAGKQAERLPYNLYKLQQLKTLKINNTCITYLPGNSNKWLFNTLQLNDVQLKADLMSAVRKMPRLRALHLCNSNASAKQFDFDQLKKLDSLSIEGNNWQNIQRTKPLHWINVKNNRIPSSLLKQHLHVEGNQDYWSVTQSQFKSKTYRVSKKDVAERFTGASTLKKTIYTHIGDNFSFQGIEFSIPPNCFMDKKTNILTGEVELWIKIHQKPSLIATRQQGLNLKESGQVDVAKFIEIRTFVEDKEVYIDQRVGINIRTPKHLKLFQFNEIKDYWKPLPSIPTACAYPSVAKVEKSSFKSLAFQYRKSIPSSSFQLRKSKVHLRLKRNKRKNTLNFELTPEYGYKESFFQLFGKRIKGYPELKTYKNLKWKYVGEQMEKDLERLYFLSDKANNEKLKRKSTFYFYVLDIHDILISPHPIKDSYVMSVIRGLDTLHIDVLPQLPIMKAKKIQKWHRKRYQKYQKKLVERKAYWKKLDSLKYSKYGSKEVKLEALRQKIIQEYWHRQKRDKKQEPAAARALSSSFLIKRTGLYTAGKQHVIEKSEQVKISAWVNKKRHYGAYFLVFNQHSKQFYWQHKNSVRVERDTPHLVFTKIGNGTYVGKILNGGEVNLKKYK